MEAGTWTKCLVHASVNINLFPSHKVWRTKEVGKHKAEMLSSCAFALPLFSVQILTGRLSGTLLGIKTTDE